MPRGAAPRGCLDFLLSPVLQASGSSLRISPVYYDCQARLDWRPRALPTTASRFLLMRLDDVLSVTSAVPNGTSFELYNHQLFTRLSLRGGLDWQLWRQQVGLKNALPVDFRPFSGAPPSAPLRKNCQPVRLRPVAGAGAPAVARPAPGPAAGAREPSRHVVPLLRRVTAFPRCSPENLEHSDNPRSGRLLTWLRQAA